MARPNRQEQIRQAALICFARHGYDATRVKHIAAEANVSEAALYSHWSSKEALAADLYSEGMRRYSAEIHELASAPDQSVRERLRAITLTSLALYRDQPQAWAFLIQQQAQFLRALPPDFPYPIHVIEELVTAGQRDATVREGDVAILGSIATGCFTYPVITALYGRQDRTDPSAAAELIADATWAAIAAR